MGYRVVLGFMWVGAVPAEIWGVLMLFPRLFLFPDFIHLLVVWTYHKGLTELGIIKIGDHHVGCHAKGNYLGAGCL